MLTVIADDITGAAEIAGIAHNHGLTTRLTVVGGDIPMSASSSAPSCDVEVIATDTRSMDSQSAIALTRAVAVLLAGRGGTVFKKTDSALRGHVMEELSELQRSLGLSRTVYMPANPSKGRTIVGGRYYINGVPIDKTDFSFDPEYPAFSSKLEERFPGIHPLASPGMHPLATSQEGGIMYADAANADDIRRIVGSAGSDTLLAGAADLFSTLLEKLFPHRSGNATTYTPDLSSYVIILQGSTQSKELRLAIPTSVMPQDVYNAAASPDRWLPDCSSKYAVSPHRLVLTMRGNTGASNKLLADKRKEAMAYAAACLVCLHSPCLLIIEGGATAFATLSRLGWSSLSVKAQLAPGVVVLSASVGTDIILKPGSYDWGEIMNCNRP